MEFKEEQRGNDNPCCDSPPLSITHWSSQSVSSSPVRASASPTLVPSLVTENTIIAPRPKQPGKSPLSRITESSSSSSSSTSTAKASSSSTSSTDRTKWDSRKDPGSGGGSRTPLSWLFKKRMKEHANEKGSPGSPSSHSVDINVESPVGSLGLFRPPEIFTWRL